MVLYIIYNGFKGFLFEGPRRIFTSEPVKNEAKEYLVRLGHRERQAWLFVDNIGNITGKSPGNLIQLDITPLLFIGENKNNLIII